MNTVSHKKLCHFWGSGQGYINIRLSINSGSPDQKVLSFWKIYGDTRNSQYSAWVWL